MIKWLLKLLLKKYLNVSYGNEPRVRWVYTQIFKIIRDTFPEDNVPTICDYLNEFNATHIIMEHENFHTALQQVMKEN